MLDFPIDGAGPLSLHARKIGMTSFAQAAEHVRALPYGRVPATGDALGVLKQGRGTCSSKHRFLATLAHECGRRDVVLMLGLYEMSERNTPGVGRVLAGAQLDSIPEAHCYLTFKGERYDFTGITAGEHSPFDSLLEERRVSPEELLEVKPRFHREALSRWAHVRGIDPQRAWAVREQCIAELEKIDAASRLN